MGEKIKRRGILLLILSLLWMLLIFGFSVQDSAESSSLSFHLLERILSAFTPHWSELSLEEQLARVEAFHFLFRKLAHFTEYAVLGILWSLTFSDLANGRKNRLLWRGLLPAGICLCYAATDELHQYFVPGRNCDFRDVCIDFLGACTGILLLTGVKYGIRRLRK